MRLYKYLLQESSDKPSQDFKNRIRWSNFGGYFSTFVTNSKKHNFRADYDGETWTVLFGFYDRKEPLEIFTKRDLDVEGKGKRKPEYEFFSNLRLVFQDFINKRKPESISFNGADEGLAKMYKSPGFKAFITKNFKFRLVIDNDNYWRYAK